MSISLFKRSVQHDTYWHTPQWNREFRASFDLAVKVGPDMYQGLADNDLSMLADHFGPVTASDHRTETISVPSQVSTALGRNNLRALHLALIQSTYR
jgi:hypothetical protein